jgi:hypothetical protein
MDIKKLMIGDWVYNKHYERNTQLTAYDFSRMDTMRMGFNTFCIIQSQQ